MSIEITELDKRGQDSIVTLRSSKGNEYKMSMYEMSRWCTMLDAIEVIDKKLHQLKMGDSNNWVKPIAIQKYIDEKYQDILFEMLETDEPIGN
jgi:hypothetical protein